MLAGKPLKPIPGTGVEPALPKELDSKSSASANSAIPAQFSATMRYGRFELPPQPWQGRVQPKTPISQGQHPVHDPDAGLGFFFC